MAEPHDGIPAVHAVAIADGNVLAEARFVRGFGGSTNFTVTARDDEKDVIEFFKNGGKWTMAPWFE